MVLFNVYIIPDLVKRGMLTLVGETRRYRNDPYYSIIIKLVVCLFVCLFVVVDAIVVVLVIQSHSLSFRDFGNKIPEKTEPSEINNRRTLITRRARKQADFTT